jgi:processive 1,2-diacylglycerol beta-glucosyltransferase
MPNKRILVLSVSAGAGHVRAAQALCAAAQSSRPDLEVTHLDVMEVVPTAFRKVYADSYVKLVDKMPLAWGYLYHSTDRRSARSAVEHLRRRIQRLNTRDLDDELVRLAPDAVVCTHFLPAELLAQRIAKHRRTPPVWVQVTDFDVHRLWIHEHMTGYCVANHEIAARVAARGIAPERIFVTGIPIMPQFGVPLDRATCAAELGIDARKPTLLMMSGGAGVGDIESLARQLLGLPHDVQIVALAGRNEKLLAALQRLQQAHPGRLYALPFTRTIERAMAAADIAITKPGGLTTSECLAMQLPMIVIAPIPGQEERNADFLLESGAALKAIDAASLEYKVRLLLDDPARLTAMRECMRAKARPDAAPSVLKLIAERL